VDIYGQLTQLAAQSSNTSSHAPARPHLCKRFCHGCTLMYQEPRLPPVDQRRRKRRRKAKTRVGNSSAWSSGKVRARRKCRS
jgi:hypothetical protein